MAKVLVINNCSECGKWFIRYGYSTACRKLGRKLVNENGRIPTDCPLDDHEDLKENTGNGGNT